MLYSSRSTFLSGCLLSWDSSGSPRFHILITTIERNKRGSFFIITFWEWKPFQEALLSWMHPCGCPGPEWCLNALLNTGRGGIAIIRGQLRSTLKPRLPCQVESLHSNLETDGPHGSAGCPPPPAGTPTPPSGCTHTPYLAWTLTLHPLAIPRGFSRN